jgi:hypothetical protein
MKAKILQVNFYINQNNVKCAELIVEDEKQAIHAFDIATFPDDKDIEERFVNGEFKNVEDGILPEQKLFFQLVEATGIDLPKPQKVTGKFWALPEFAGKEIEIEIENEFVGKVKSIKKVGS